MATALVNIAFGFGHAYLWFCVCWGLNGALQVCSIPFAFLLSTGAYHVCGSISSVCLLYVIWCLSDICSDWL